MTYLKITLLLCTFTAHAMADVSVPIEGSESHEENQAQENQEVNSASYVFTETSRFFTELFEDWFGQSTVTDTEGDQEPAVIVKSADSHKEAVTVTVTPEIVEPQPQELNVNDQISELEKRRLAMEMKRLEAEEKRLAAAEKRLAAAERRLAAEEIRLASEEQKLLSSDASQLSAQISPKLNGQSKVPASLNGQNKQGNGSPKSDTQSSLSASNNTVADQSAEKPKKKLQSVVSTTKNPAFIKLENQYYLDLYKWELKTEVYRLVKYPDWAKSLKKAGNVSLDFTVNRNAEVSKVKGDNSKISIQLVSELHRAIIAAAKRVLPPDALPGDSWNMSMSYNFQLEDVEQVALVKPTKPLFLEREHSIVVIDNDNNLEKYQKDVHNLITEGIEYPVWAKNLRQRGTVSFEIVINQDGTISEITPKGKNRHSFLNQEVLRAINDSAPLPTIPEHLRLQSTNMVIEHEFRK